MKETFFGVLQEVNKVDDGKLVPIGIIDYIKELGFIQPHELKPLEVGIRWEIKDGDTHIHEIYVTSPHINEGEVLVDFNDENYTDAHEDLYEALLMYADFEPDNFGWL